MRGYDSTMGRSPLNVKSTNVRLPEGLGERIDKLVDIGGGQLTERRKDIAFRAGDHILGMKGFPTALLNRMPFARTFFEGVGMLNGARDLRFASLHAGVAVIAQDFARLVAQSPCVCRGYLRIGAEHQSPLLAVEAIFKAP